MTRLLAPATVAALLVASAPAQKLPEPGSFRFALEAGRHRSRFGAARFESDLDPETDEPRFVLGLLTGGAEAGLYLVRAGADPLEKGEHPIAAVEVDTNGGFERTRLSRERLAVFFFELGPERALILGSTGQGSVTITDSTEEGIRGHFRISMKGYDGNPRALFGIRPREGVVTGGFDASPGSLGFRSP